MKVMDLLLVTNIENLIFCANEPFYINTILLNGEEYEEIDIKCHIMPILNCEVLQLYPDNDKIVCVYSI